MSRLANRESYESDGLVVVRGLFSSDEIAELAEEAARIAELADLIDSDNLRRLWQDHHETCEFSFDCFDPAIDLGPSFHNPLAHGRTVPDHGRGMSGRFRGSPATDQVGRRNTAEAPGGEIQTALPIHRRVSRHAPKTLEGAMGYNPL